MAIVQSPAGLVDTQPNWWPVLSYGSMRFYDRYNYDYATIFRTQPNVRTCVEFLARNIAQLGLHVFRRVSDTDRKRLTDHPLAVVLKRPLPAEFKVTYYRLIEALVGDLGIYFNAYWLKVRAEGAPLGLLRVPPQLVTVKGGLAIDEYEVNLGTTVKTFQPGEIVHFRGYNPESATSGMPPLETLRRILAEEHAAGEYREYFWQNAARMQGIVERPDTAPDWSTDARERFKAEFSALYSGGENSGKTAVLEEGMTWKPMAFNAQESEYLAGRKLTREECARAYHIPLPLVGILDHATFSNIKEQHKHLYQDSLGPWLAMIEGDIMLQLLPEFADVSGVYVEFNIAEKLQGSFEEQITSLQSAVGRPWMTANEARARMNLPRLGGDADVLVTPLNVIVGGQASPRDSGNSGIGIRESGIRERKGIDSHRAGMRERHEEQWASVLGRHYRRQEAAVLSRLPKAKASKVMIGDVWFDQERWNEELATDLLRLNRLTAMAWAEMITGDLEPEKAVRKEVDEGRMAPWLEEHARIQAENINGLVAGGLGGALDQDDPHSAVQDLFAIAATVWAWRQARSGVTSASNFGASEGAMAGGLRRKTWRVNSNNPRDAHLAMNGETTGIRDRFSNGMKWPGDPAGGAENNANCMCSVEFDV